MVTRTKLHRDREQETGAREPTGRPRGGTGAPAVTAASAQDDGNTTGAEAGAGTERESEKTAWSQAPLPGPRPNAK